MAPVCLFDVNETLLDLAALDGEFERLFGDRGARVAWFGPLARPPDLVVTDLGDLATRLLA